MKCLMPFCLSLLLALPPVSIINAQFSAAKTATSSPQSGRLYAALPNGFSLPVDISRPSGCAPRGIMVVFAGYRRNSATYRKNSEKAARALCLLVFAPHFAKNRFPPADYQYGGKGLAVMKPLLAWIGAQTGNSLPVILVGHSAGAQYLGWVTAYAPVTAPAIARSISGAPATPTIARIILISAGTYAEPALPFAPPYGFKGKGQKRLKTYLAAPIAVLVGSEDIKANAHLAQTPLAAAQGANRLQRVQNFRAKGKAEAARLKTPFGWDFHIIPGLGHNSRAPLQSPVMEEILRQSLPPLPRKGKNP